MFCSKCNCKRETKNKNIPEYIMERFLSDKYLYNNQKKIYCEFIDGWIPPIDYEFKNRQQFRLQTIVSKIKILNLDLAYHDNTKPFAQVIDYDNNKKILFDIYTTLEEDIYDNFECSCDFINTYTFRVKPHKINIGC